MRRTLALIGIVSSIACSSPTTSTPTPTPTPAILAVSGSVSDVLHRRVANVRIEVVSGPQKGTVTFSDDAGNFAIEPKLSPLSRIQASKQGYVDSVQVVSGTGPTVDVKFLLSSANPPLDWRGTYDVTLTADATCTELPEIARRRTYTATVGATVVFSGARFGSSGGFDWNTMYVFQVDDYVDMWAQDPPLVELLPDNTFFMLYGGATGTVTREGAHLTMYGGISYCPKLSDGQNLSCAEPPTICVSNRHQMTMTRRQSGSGGS